MTGKQRRQYEMFLKVIAFFTQHAADFPAASIGGKLFAVVQSVAAQIAQIAVNQSSTTGTTRQSFDVQEDARDAVRVMMLNISAMARAMGFEINGLEDKFRMPRTRADQALLAAARAFAADAVAFAEQFVAYGLPATFIDDLTAAADAFAASLAQTDAAELNQVGTTAAFVPQIKEGLIAVRRLDPIVKARYRGNAKDYAAWAFAKHVERDLPPADPTTPTA